MKIPRDRESEFELFTENAHKYGFAWGQVVVQRTAEINGRKIITVATPRETLELWVTRTGMIRLQRR